MNAASKKVRLALSRLRAARTLLSSARQDAKALGADETFIDWLRYLSDTGGDLQGFAYRLEKAENQRARKTLKRALYANQVHA